MPFWHIDSNVIHVLLWFVSWILLQLPVFNPMSRLLEQDAFWDEMLLEHIILLL